MNIKMQICGMVILIVLTVFYKSNKTLRIYTEKFFMRVMMVAISSLSLDIMSLVAIEYRHTLSAMLVELICKTYIISLIWVGMVGTVYVLTDALKEDKLRNISTVLLTVTLIQSMIIYALPIYIFENGKEAYTYGPAVLCVYFFALMYVVATCVILFIFYNKVSRRREFAVGLWMLMWIIAAVIQFFNNEMLLVGFATAIGVLILFVMMENPESNLDRRLGCFNSYALTEYLNELQKREKQFGILVLSFGNARFMEEHRSYAETILRSVVNAIRKEKKVMMFKNARQGLLFIGTDGDGLYKVGLDVYEVLSKNQEWQKETRLTLIRKGESLKNSEEIFSFLSFLQQEYANEKERVFSVGEAVVELFRQRYVMEQKIAEALEEDRVEVHLQPVYCPKDKQYTSAEAMVRIREKDGSLISPAQFITAAENSGQVLELGERVFEKVCQFLRDSDAVKLGISHIKINLSVVQCGQKDLSGRFTSILEKYKVLPTCIDFEITETASMSSKSVIFFNIRKLVDYGFKFSLDDFGKGHSNLMYVVEMPISTIKLNIDMIKEYFTNAKAKMAVKAVVAMSHGMGIKVVAEGIENKEAMEAMVREGVDFVQGYYFAKPLSMPEFIEFIKREQKPV